MYIIVSKSSDRLILQNTYHLLGFIFYFGLFFVSCGFFSAALIPEMALTVIPFQTALLAGLLFLRFRNRLLIFDRNRKEVVRKNDLFGWIYHESVVASFPKARRIRIQGRIAHGRSTFVHWEAMIDSQEESCEPLFSSYNDLLAIRALAREIAGFISVPLEEIDETGNSSTFLSSPQPVPPPGKDEPENHLGGTPSDLTPPTSALFTIPAHPVAKPVWVTEKESRDSYEVEAPYRQEHPGGWQIPTVFLALLCMDLFGWISGKNPGINPVGVIVFIGICLFFILYNRRARTSVVLDRSAVKITFSTLQGDVVNWIPLSDLENITMEATSEHYGKLHFLSRNQEKSVVIEVTNPFGHFLEYQLKTRMAR
jgi:hypothetical protein